RSIWLVGRKRLFERAVFAVAEGVLALQDGVNLARALVDDRRAGVAQEPLDRVIGRVAVRAVHLDGVVSSVEGCIGRVLLSDRHIAGESRALALHASRLVIEEAADRVAAEPAGDQLLHKLV